MSLDTSAEIVPIEERLRSLVEHTRLFLELLPHKNFAVMKKHYKAYVNGFSGAVALRGELMAAETIEEIEAHISQFLSTYQS
jgi:tRNA-dihydrouridine synthase